MNTTPAPLCACGCGEAVNRYTKTVNAKDRRKGEYGKYKRGHWANVSGLPKGTFGKVGRTEYARLWWHLNKESESAKAKVASRKLKYEVVRHYSGGSMRCACCFQMGLEFLTVDHIEPVRRALNERSTAGSNLYKQIKAAGFPDGFQILCFNCNCAKRDNGYCPHQTVMMTDPN